MDVVVNEIVAVLEVLALGDTVGGDDEIDFIGLVREDESLFLGDG